MRKLIMVIVFLMTIVVSADAQKRVYDDVFNVPIYERTPTNKSFWDKQQMFSIGVTVGSVYKGDKSYFYYGADFVIAGAFMGLTLSDTSCEEKGDYSLNTGFQFGYFFPVCKFGKEDGIRDNGWDNALLISPLVEFKSLGKIFLDLSVNLEKIANKISVI